MSEDLERLGPTLFSMLNALELSSSSCSPSDCPVLSRCPVWLPSSSSSSFQPDSFSSSFFSESVAVYGTRVSEYWLNPGFLNPTRFRRSDLQRTDSRARSCLITGSFGTPKESFHPEKQQARRENSVFWGAKGFFYQLMVVLKYIISAQSLA